MSMRDKLWILRSSKVWGGTTPDMHHSEPELLRQARQRVKKPSDRQLMAWGDAASAGLQQAFEDYEAHGDVDSLNEIRAGSIAMLALADELLERHHSKEAVTPQ